MKRRLSFARSTKSKAAAKNSKSRGYLLAPGSPGNPSAFPVYVHTPTEDGLDLTAPLVPLPPVAHPEGLSSMVGEWSKSVLGKTSSTGNEIDAEEYRRRYDKTEEHGVDAVMEADFETFVRKSDRAEAKEALQRLLRIHKF